MTIPNFETTFAVPLTCESCIKDVSDSLYKLKGIHNVTASLPHQLISITGTAAPSAIVSAIQSTGRDAILRGSGRPDSAAVCILETHADSAKGQNAVKGLVRMVQVAQNMTIVDLTIRGLREGVYWATVRECGDISRGPESTGGIWEGQISKSTQREGGSPAVIGRGVFGTLEIGKSGVGSLFTDKPVQIWELIGRSVVVSREQEGPFDAQDENCLVGVVARSAGIWENDKVVCSCTGKTVWQERVDAVGRGML